MANRTLDATPQVPQAVPTAVTSTSHQPAAPGLMAGLGRGVAKDTAVLQRMTDGRLPRAGNALLQLQRSHGNRHVQRVVAQAQNRTGLPDDLKAGVETLSGLSLNDVQVHYNSSRPTKYEAHAYTQGSEIYVSPGKEKYVPHEAWHVIQQKQGRVRPTMHLKGTAVSEDTVLEQEADTMGQKALTAAQTIQAKGRPPGTARPYSPVIQRAHDSAEQDDSDHGTDSLDLNRGTSYIDWSELTKQALQRRSDDTLKAVFYNLVMYHFAKAGLYSQLPSPNASEVDVAYQQWKHGGVYTRARFKNLIGIMANEGDDKTSDIIQRKRTGNTYSVNGGYQGTSNSFNYDNVIYYRDSDGNINFGTDPSSIIGSYNTTEASTIASGNIKWKDPMKSGSTVNLANDLTDPKAGLMPSGKKVTLRTATRSQHFAIADDLYPNSRGGTWTWHHLTPKYYMILVDMRVHAKHGHNGGVYLW